MKNIISSLFPLLFVAAVIASGCMTPQQKASLPNKIGIEYFKQGKYKHAIKKFKEAKNIYSDDPTIYYNIGISYQKIGKHDKAIKYFKKAINKNPDNAAAYNDVGSSYYKSGNPKKAIAAVKRAVEINPRLLRARFNLGELYLQTGRYYKAIVEFKHVMKIDPEDAEVRERLGIVYAKLNRARRGKRVKKTQPELKKTVLLKTEKTLSTSETKPLLLVTPLGKTSFAR